MAITEKITCDVCGKEKQAVNHWFMYAPIIGADEIRILTWDAEQVLKTSHLCGQECAIKKLSGWMQEKQTG